MIDWRELVHAYLVARRDDVQRIQELRLSGAEAQFLDEHAMDSLKQHHVAVVKARCEALGQPPPKESYEMIEESADRVLAQVRPQGRSSPDELRVPYLTVRFLLTKDEVGWKIAGIYHPCFWCNARAGEGSRRNQPGKCMFCRGSGKFPAAKVVTRGFWIFKRRYVKAGPCKNCDGTGSCPKCAGEEMSGWQRMSALGG